MRKGVVFLMLFVTALMSWARVPDVMLLKRYEGQSLAGWVMSEKLDGVRGFWTGQTLLSRQGNAFLPPSDFLENFPPFSIDGELFSARGEFSQISSIVRSQQDVGWHRLKLYVFDVPNAKGNLWQRLQVLRDYLTNNPAPHIEIIEQIPIQNKAHMQRFLHEVEQKGGEGVVVRNPNMPYQHGRSSQILKVKSRFDDECTVVRHIEGKGQFAGMLGAISCVNRYGVFKIGSGFSVEQRQNPPAVGSKITYQYQGFTAQGKPRFAIFLRERNDEVK
ncbi:DNA ligase [Pasteurellaceae bacterium HPA106]|uniref:DNA ligase n=1 Tax=Spirabiliibacterium pneumoniae TaxID=221400 RepID=UPI001AACB5F0|nr:DNA ligase [Spirabiliibacterium pneumoniae]MBE2896004.1 DNA ligase [Spirabiliibacterium pneumoniae]